MHRKQEREPGAPSRSTTPERMEVKTAERLQQLVKAHAKWQDQVLNGGQKTPFGPQWLQNNDYNGLYQWAGQYFGGIDDFVKLAPEHVQVDFQRRERREAYTQETAIAAFEKAYQQWLLLPEPRPSFDWQWLRQKRHTSFYAWMQENGGIEKYLPLCSSGVQTDFRQAKIRQEGLTPETAVQLFDQAHQQWRQLPGQDRVPFSMQWLKDNNYTRLISWVHDKKMAFADFVKTCSAEARADFEIRAEYSDDDLLSILEQTYKQWLEIGQPNGKSFNPQWLKDHALSCYEAMKKRGGIDAFVARASQEIRRDFSKRVETVWTVEIAIDAIRKALVKFRILEPSKKMRFTWMRNNGFSGAVAWIIKQPGGLSDFYTQHLPPDLKASILYSASEDAVESSGVRPSEMIDLQGVQLANLHPDVRVPQLSAVSTATSVGAEILFDGVDPSALQELRLTLERFRQQCRPLDDNTVDLLIEFYTYLPDFIFHQLMARDIAERVLRGELPMPKTVLSLGGGPYGEAIAWKRLQSTLSARGISVPTTHVVDARDRMLKKGAEMVEIREHVDRACIRGIEERLSNLEAAQLPADIDMIECTNIAACEDGSVEHALAVVLRMQQNAIIRLGSRRPIPDAILTLLRSQGFQFLTPVGAKIYARNEAFFGLAANILERLQQKTVDGYFYLIASREKQSATADVPAPVSSSPREEKPKATQVMTEVEKAINALVQLPADQQAEKLFDLANRYGAACIPDEILANLGYEKYSVTRRGQTTWGIRRISASKKS